MTATAHALVGGVIVAALPDNPALGITLVAISHPILDMIPHWDFGLDWKKKSKTLLFFQSLADLVFGVALTFYLFGNASNVLYLSLAIFVSESWDLMMMPYLLFGWKFPPFSFFYRFGHATNRTATLPWGILSQAATVTGILLFFRIVPIH